METSYFRAGGGCVSLWAPVTVKHYERAYDRAVKAPELTWQSDKRKGAPC